MGLETRLWRTGYADNLLTTVPRAVRQQLGLGPDDKIVWRIEGGVAEVRRAEAPAAAGATGAGAANGDVHAYTLYKQSRGNSLYTAIPMSVIEQLRLTDRSRAEWELHGDHARLRRA